jgi:ubiquinone/menaquinone biosynthesis C-methylase UbiE
MTTSGSYNASTYHEDLESEIQRLHAQVLLSWEEEASTLARFGIHDGMSVLELGSGPGFFTEKLLTLLPNSSVTAVEIDSVLIERAKQHLQEKASERICILEASVMDTRLPDSSFDFAIARFILDHLPDPIGVAREVLRILRPGGKFVIISGDRGITPLVDPPVSELQLLYEKIAQFRASEGGNPFIGRQLWNILQTAGFQYLDLEAIAFHSGEKSIEAFLPQFNPGQLLHQTKSGMLSEQEVAIAIAAREKFLASPNSFILMLWFMACGEKICTS